MELIAVHDIMTVKTPAPVIAMFEPDFLVHVRQLAALGIGRQVFYLVALAAGENVRAKWRGGNIDLLGCTFSIRSLNLR